MRWVRLLLCSIAAAAMCSCELEERADFLVGRACQPEPPTGCDPEQACLPHEFVGELPSEYRCRDAESLNNLGSAEPPLAYCLPERGILCPLGAVCNAGRIRSDSGPRRLICKPDDDAFGPPAPDGGA